MVNQTFAGVAPLSEEIAAIPPRHCTVPSCRIPDTTPVAMWKLGDSVPEGYVLANDGLPARKQGLWARDKLRFLEEYLPPAVGATRRKGSHTHYLSRPLIYVTSTSV